MDAVLKGFDRVLLGEGKNGFLTDDDAEETRVLGGVTTRSNGFTTAARCVRALSVVLEASRASNDAGGSLAAVRSCGVALLLLLVVGFDLGSEAAMALAYGSAEDCVAPPWYVAALLVVPRHTRSGAAPNGAWASPRDITGWTETEGLSDTVATVCADTCCLWLEFRASPAASLATTVSNNPTWSDVASAA